MERPDTTTERDRGSIVLLGGGRKFVVGGEEWDNASEVGGRLKQSREVVEEDGQRGGGGGVPGGYESNALLTGYTISLGWYKVGAGCLYVMSGRT